MLAFHCFFVARYSFIVIIIFCLLKFLASKIRHHRVSVVFSDIKIILDSNLTARRILVENIITEGKFTIG